MDGRKGSNMINEVMDEMIRVQLEEAEKDAKASNNAHLINAIKHLCIAIDLVSKKG